MSGSDRMIHKIGYNKEAKNLKALQRKNIKLRRDKKCS
jgi:hypothetical protein